MADSTETSNGGRGINRGVKGGQISDEVRREAQKHASPVVNNFLIAARRGFTSQVLEGIKEGGSEQANLVDKHGRNCLQLAATHGHFETVYHILQTGLVDVNAVNKRGLTALHDASMEGHARIVLLLLALGADITCRTKDGWSCLMSASSNGHYQMASILISTGCSIDAQTKLGLTALHIAAWKGHSDVVQLLLQHGADPSALTHNNKTPLQLAQEENRHHCVSILTAATAKDSEEPRYRISSLEGQLRLYQAKLTEAHHNHSAELATQQVHHEEKLANLRAEHDEKMKEMAKEHDERMKEMAKKIEELEKRYTSTQVPGIAISRTATPTPPPLLKARRYHRRSDGLASSSSSNVDDFVSRHSPVPPKIEDDGRISRASRTSSGDKLRLSASYDNLSLSGLDDVQVSKNHSNDSLVSPKKTEPPKEAIRKDSTDRLTITDLFERSLKNPTSMSSIRKEIKADGLTPKIRRKFQNRGSSNSAKLPSVSPKSGLIQDSRSDGKVFGKDILGKTTNIEQ